MLDIYRGAMTAQGQSDLDPRRRWTFVKSSPWRTRQRPSRIARTRCASTPQPCTGTSTRNRPARISITSLHPEVATEIENLFPRLDNPDIVIYVYPHLATRTRAPIPGYSTVIPLYDQVHYRLPGESQRTTPTALAGAAVTTGNPRTPGGHRPACAQHPFLRGALSQEQSPGGRSPVTRNSTRHRAG